MKLEEYVYRDQKRLRCGYTTGSCAAAAAKAAAQMLLSGERVDQVALSTPKGVLLQLPVGHIRLSEESVSCAVQKDSGDDPDVTDGVGVFAEVRRADKGVYIAGGEGIGRVTRPGLACAVGEAAINPGPRRMIANVLQEVGETYGYTSGWQVTLSVPEGKRLAEKTFNPRLGITGGISILGTSGIVEPMSERALVDTIRTELRQLRTLGARTVVAVPGNYGETFLREQMRLPCRAVSCSNYIGELLDMAVDFGFEGLLLVGHAGKLVKLAGGVMNTHSRYADARMEIITAHAALCGVSPVLAGKLMDCVTTDEAFELLQKEQLLSPVMDSLIQKIHFHINARVRGQLTVGAVLFSNAFGLLGQTAEVDGLLQRLKGEEIE